MDIEWTDERLQQHVNDVAVSDRDRRLSTCAACTLADQRGITPSVGRIPIGFPGDGNHPRRPSQ